MSNDVQMALSQIENKVHKAINNINESIDSRISMAVKSEISNSIEYNVNNHLKAIEKISVEKPLSVEQLTRLYQDVYQALQDLKINTNGYGLYESMQHLSNAFQNSQSKLQEVCNNVEKLIQNKYIEAEITGEHLKYLYDRSGVAHDKIAAHFNVSIPTVYTWLNGKTKSLKVKNELKIYLENIIKQEEAKNA